MDAPTAEPAAPAPRRWSLATKTGERTALAALLIVTAVSYLWNITINGMGNQFYAAAVWAGSQNWEALLFGSIDPHNVITVDKPPLSQWVMALSGQIFGFSSASMLIPEALMAVASVWLLYAAVRRISGPAAGLFAGAVLALTPVAVMMFRFNNPDAAMVLLMTLAAYFTVRALEKNGAKWMALAGVALGFAFLAKMLEGVMVVPALGLVYLIAAPVALRSRIWHLAGALLALVVSSGWYVVLTILWPASSRPYMAGSTDNSFMNLVLGYNGFGRVLGKNHMGKMDPDTPSTVHTVTGEHVGHAAGEAINTAQHHGGFGDQVQGLPRLFSGEFGFEIGWLVPAALLATVFVLISRGRAPRTDLVRAGALLFGGWLVSVGLVLSFMKTNVHPYYCLAVAPAVAAIFAIAVVEMWRKRDSLLHRIGLATMLLGSGVWGFVILGRNADWLPALRWVLLVAAVAGSVALVWAAGRDNRKRIATLALGLAMFGAVGGSVAYSVATFGQPHLGGGPSVGPADKDDNGHGGWGQNDPNPQLNALLKATDTKWSAAINRSSAAAGLELDTRTPVIAIGGFGGTDPAPTLQQFQSYVAGHEVGYYIVSDNKGHWGGDSHSDIADWVSANFAPIKVGSDTVYNLTQPLKK
ncbi:glycosyltransferase family 39 protein [Mycobacterium sp. CBMA293]|uniref:ArnT family glycosyltransferase n=1 Tax=unclassified Mycolicibacterium TaxID=2636767 RepID=UPI0012DC1D44|nr:MULTISPECIES: glycosyltransferase family 39 protein [unclassified Mycolicibacterium]MUL44766.1 glycosyltransferase family 39 protein [Mycolicibacterium sp. CBMA 360]MUL58126.1 glycosyltransferase family 39 protein [Mycolicibacterium sp. CBMA 335]MUL73584.1 glycosyltransferase family 39 protein [Mycolicibacterium sp. CBMA 311]MUL93009.1 glycosyltransferase family 39 protein [Mycolicibacterium sp. CBMA 230]MUM09852.1 glycosyltransferase family 39 protein [Mycolicibacterium sp. CBMA 293]